MLQQLHDLGAYLMEYGGQTGVSNYLDSGELEAYEKIIAVQFSDTPSGYQFTGVSVSDMDGYEDDVLYKWGSPRGGDLTPTSRITRIHTLEEKEDPDSKMDTISRVFELWYEKSSQDDALVSDIVAEYNDSEGDIRREIVQAFTEIEGDVVLTVQYEQDNEMVFLSEIELFNELVKENVEEQWTEKHNESSYSVDAQCSTCHKDGKVFGFAFPLPLYTVDNRKAAPDFDQSQSWKNLPLCNGCAMKLRVATGFLKENSFGFFLGGDNTLQYYVIPDFPLTGPQDDAVMELFTNGVSSDQEYSFMDVERLYTLDDVSYPMSLSLIFYSENQSQQQIELAVHGVEPPWMRHADQTLRDVYNTIYNTYDGADVDYYLEDPEELKQFNRLIYRVLPRTYGDSEAFLSDALELVERVLKNESVSYDRMLSLVDEELRSRFRNDENHRGYALRVFLFLTFLNEMGILERERSSAVHDYEAIMDSWGENTPSELEAFFAEFNDAFNQPAERAVFIEGVLAQHLMDVQSQVRSGDPPLRKKISNLRLTQPRAKTLLTELFHDIDVYDNKSEYPVEYRGLREAAARYFAEADQVGWDISDEEVRYYFTLGCSLNRAFKQNNSDVDSDSNTGDEMETPTHGD